MSSSTSQAVLQFIMFLECLEITAIPLPQLPKCQDYRGKMPYVAIRSFFILFLFFTSIFPPSRRLISSVRNLMTAFFPVCVRWGSTKLWLDENLQRSLTSEC